MNRRTNGGAGRQPDGQSSRGYPKADRPNPKNNSSRRKDVVGKVPGDGGAALINDPDNDGISTGYPATGGPNRFGKGTAAADIGGDSINRGYTTVTYGDVPNVTKVTSANRQNYGIDPGQVTQPDGDTTDGPGVPKFGTGTTAD